MRYFLRFDPRRIQAHEARSKQYSGKMIGLEPLSWVGLCWAVLAEEATNLERRLFSWM
jgi:hypothetical protein